MTELVLVIGDKNLSSWSMRPWLLLTQAGLAFRERVVLFESEGWRDEIAALSPSRRVPAFHAGDLLIWDSLAICEWIAETFPDAKLWPDARDARAIARSVSAEMHAGFASLRSAMSMDVVARHPAAVMSAETEADVRRVQAIWTDCRERFGAGGPFLFGRFSVADAMYAPVVWRFRTYGVSVEEPAARAYFEMMLTLPAMKAWERDAEAEVAARRIAKSAKSASGAPAPRSAQHCFAVIFSSRRRRDGGAEADVAYDKTAAAMVDLARKQPGFLGIESARSPDGFGITVSYWESLEAVRAWKDEPAHAAVQARGREKFYESYEVRVCTVDRAYGFR
ncbi:MAG: glutathione S-transferase N-terminal domain-containing protein [Labilithrix sp.]|nr:glutathione S-transferase N-terminal domain-containing protein [Labilithrix sp.]